MQAIFGKSLLTCANVELWKAYLAYIRAAKVDAVNPDDAEAMKVGKAAMVEAYEFALKHIGIAVDSFPIWHGSLHTH